MIECIKVKMSTNTKAEKLHTVKKSMALFRALLYSGMIIKLKHITNSAGTLRIVIFQAGKQTGKHMQAGMQTGRQANVSRHAIAYTQTDRHMQAGKLIQLGR